MSSAQELKLQGNKAFVEKDYDKAIDLYSQAIEKDSSDVSFFSNRSGAYFNKGDFENAVQDADQCLELDTNFIKGYTRKGMALEKLGKKDEAFIVFEEGLKVDENNKDLISGKERCDPKSESQFDMNSLLQNPMIQDLIQKNPQLAQQLFQNPELMKNPQMMQTMMNMFAQQQSGQQGQPPQQPTQQTQNQFNPQNQFQEQSEQQSHSPSPQKNQNQTVSDFDQKKKEADGLYMKKKFDEAIEAYQQCIELNPTHMIPRSNQAVCYIEKKDYEKAHEVLDEAIKVYKESEFDKRSFEDYAKILEKKARIYSLQDNFDEGIKFYEQSLLENQVGSVSAKLRELKRRQKKINQEKYIDPEMSEKHRAQGNEHYKSQNYPEAIKEYEEAQKRNPKDHKVYNNLCACFMKLLRFDEAKKYAEKVLELDPVNIKALLKKAQIHSFLKEFHKAIEFYQVVMKIEPQNLDAQKGLADTQMKIQQSMHSGNDEERLQRAMQDPEIKSIMMDPMVRIALEQMQKSPQTSMEYMQDVTLGPKIQKLIQAGVIKVG